MAVFDIQVGNEILTIEAPDNITDEELIAQVRSTLGAPAPIASPEAPTAGVGDVIQPLTPLAPPSKGENLQNLVKQVGTPALENLNPLQPVGSPLDAAGAAVNQAIAGPLPGKAITALRTPEGLTQAAQLAPAAGVAAGSLLSPVFGTALGATGGTAIRDIILAALGDEGAPQTAGETLGNQALAGGVTLATAGLLKGGGATIGAVSKGLKLARAPGSQQAGTAIEEALKAGGAKPGGLPSTPADLAQFAKASQTRLRQAGVTNAEIQEIRELITRTFGKAKGDIQQALGRTRVTADKLIRERIPSVGPALNKFRDAKSKEALLSTGRKLGKRVAIGAGIGIIQAAIIGTLLRGRLGRN